MTCSCSNPVIDEDTRQVNENSRQVTQTCLRCETVVSNEIVEVPQWSA